MLFPKETRIDLQKTQEKKKGTFSPHEKHPKTPVKSNVSEVN